MSMIVKACGVAVAPYLCPAWRTPHPSKIVRWSRRLIPNTKPRWSATMPI